MPSEAAGGQTTGAGAHGTDTLTPEELAELEETIGVRVGGARSAQAAPADPYGLLGGAPRAPAAPPAPSVPQTFAQRAAASSDPFLQKAYENSLVGQSYGIPSIQTTSVNPRQNELERVAAMRARQAPAGPVMPGQ